MKEKYTKLMQEKLKVWQQSTQQNIFQILQEVQNFLFTVKIMQLFVATIL